MTKGELMKLLEPFDDEIELVGNDGSGFYVTFVNAHYDTDVDGNGIAVLVTEDAV